MRLESDEWSSTARNIVASGFQGSSGCQNLYRARFVSLESQKEEQVEDWSAELTGHK